MIVKKSMPYALLIFLMSIYYYSDVVMVERIRGNIEVANYAHGYRFFMAFNMLGYLFAGLLLPIFSKLIKEKQSVLPVSWLSFKLIYFFGLVICITVWTYKMEILNWRYEINGSSLLHSSETFGWLMISFIAVSCNYIFGTLLTAKGRMKQLNILAVFGILINISLNLLLIPDKGSSGAAFASAFTQFFVLVFQIALCYKIFNFKYHLIGIRPGEKIHETLCPQDSARDTIEFKKYFIIRPNFDFSQGKSKNYLLSKSKEIGKKVSDNFIYSSDQNTHFLSVNEIKKLNN